MANDYSVLQPEEDEVMKEFMCIGCHEFMRPFQICTDGHNACWACIQKIKARNNKCPECTKPIFPSVAVNLLAVRLAKNLGLVTCKNIGCHVMFYADRSEHDESACPFFKAPCAFGCGIQVMRSELDAHAEKCTFKPVTCSNAGCETQCLLKDRQAHKVTCPRRLIRCRWKCSHKLAACEAAAHEEACLMRKVSCPNAGCTLTNVVTVIDAHAPQCPHLPVTCDHCEQSHPLSAHAEHVIFCEQRRMPCLVCDQPVVQGEYAEHVREHGLAYWAGQFLCSFDVAGFRSTAVDLGVDGVVALLTDKTSADGWDMRLSLRATEEFAPTAATVSVELADGVTLSARLSVSNADSSLVVPGMLLASNTVTPRVTVRWD